MVEEGYLAVFYDFFTICQVCLFIRGGYKLKKDRLIENEAEMKVSRNVLMCGPDYYGVKYEINPWMRIENQPDGKKAILQWNTLKGALEQAGLSVSLIGQSPELPDMVFTANAGLIHNRTIILSNFRYPERRGEKKFFREYFLSLGYQFESLPHGFFEGEGDAIFCGDEFVCGYGFRTDELGAILVGYLIDKEPILLELTDPHFYHLDTCFCPLKVNKKNLIICYLQAFDSFDQAKIERLGEIIPVSRCDAESFVCNAVQIGDKIVTTPMSKHLKNTLEKHNIEPLEVDLSEFIKAGGAAKCLTLFI